MNTTQITKDEYRVISDLLDKREAIHLIGFGNTIRHINKSYIDFFKCLPTAVQILSAHAGDDEHIKSFISNLSAVSEALAVITECRTQLSDLEQLLCDLEYADVYYHKLDAKQ